MNNKKAYFLGSSICKSMKMGDFKFLGLWKDYHEFMKNEGLGAYRMDQDCFAAVPGLNFVITRIQNKLLNFCHRAFSSEVPESF